MIRYSPSGRSMGTTIVCVYSTRPDQAEVATAGAWSPWNAVPLAPEKWTKTVRSRPTGWASQRYVSRVPYPGRQEVGLRTAERIVERGLSCLPNRRARIAAAFHDIIETL